METFRQLDGSGGLNLLSRLLPDEERPDVDASGDGCWNARCLTGTSRCNRSPGASRLAEDQVVLVDVARDLQGDVVAGPRMIHLPVLDLGWSRPDSLNRLAQGLAPHPTRRGHEWA
ncbi:MAG TPA: hypothetical protein VF312_07995 [Propionibacteriaceae bacterium]